MIYAAFLKSKKLECFDPNIGWLSKKGIIWSKIISNFATTNSPIERVLCFNTKPPPLARAKNFIKLSNNKKSLECWEIEKRNEVDKPVLVLAFWTAIKK